MAELLEMKPSGDRLEPVEAVVNRLKCLLKQAETGELRSLAYAGEYCKDPSVSREKGASWAFCGERWNACLLGGLEILKVSMAQETIEYSDTHYDFPEGSEEPDPAG